MKKSILYILQALLVTATFQACHDELDQLPNSVVTSENAIIDQPSAEIALNGAYYHFAGGEEASTGSRVDWALHEATGSTLGGTMYSFFFEYDMMVHKIKPDFYWCEDMWYNSYKVVNAASGVIQGVEKLHDGKFIGNRKNEILGEARFLRAYGHWMLLSYFGQFYDVNSQHGILLRKDFVTSENISLPKSTVSESYDHILEDLDFAIANAPSTNKAFYATKWAAMLLKARIIINRNTPGDYSEVVSLTENVIANGPFILEPNVKDLFVTKGLESKEVILGIKPKKDQTYKEEDYLSYYTWEPSEYMIDTLLLNDPRKDWMIGEGQTWWGGTIATITKYEGDHHEVSYAFRLTEAYLLQAEALVRSGGDITKAKNRLRTIMERAGITDFTALDAAGADDVLMLIWEEVAKNLCYEDGQEWFALLRFPMATVQAMQPSIVSKDQIIFPIPKIEIQRNPNMVQNPGYPNN